MMGVFDHKRDLGLHTEMCARGIGRLVRDGVITGARKQLFPNKAVASTWSGCDPADMAYINDNPKFALTLMPSTALGGAVSRIVPHLEEGSLVTIPRYFADNVVTEYSVARLMGKTCRQRAEELINIAHPDHRAELRKAAQELFYP